MKASTVAQPRWEAWDNWRRPLLLATVLASGCQQLEPGWQEGTTEAEAALAGTASAWREAAMNRRWQNRPLSELKLAMGEPRLLMQIPGGGNPPGFAAVYGVDQATGCIDSFALFHGRDPLIRVYHCR